MSQIEQEITALWGHITAATHRFLELVAEFDEAEGWNGAGIANCAHWLNVYCGIGIVAAREKVRVAHAIRTLPQINAAFREGRVSYSKVRAMTRVATPANEETLLNIAIHGTAAHVERAVRQFRRVERIEATMVAREAHRDRFIDLSYDDDDHVVIRGRLPAEVGELVRLAIERAMDLLESGAGASLESRSGSDSDWDSESDSGTGSTAESRSASEARPTYGPDQDDSAESSSSAQKAQTGIPEDRDPIGARRADALELLAQRFLADEAASAGSASDRYQVVVHIDQGLLSSESGVGHCDEPGAERHGVGGAGLSIQSCAHQHGGSRRCEVEDGPTLAAETARRLACDGSLVGIVDGDGGEPLSVGRKTRAISPALRRALKARDQGCRFPGCTHTRFTEGHHVEHWANGGETKLSNLITLCRFHHHLLHEGGFGLRRTHDGLFVFSTPNGRRLPAHGPGERRFRGSALPDINRERGIDIAPDTIVTRWQGERMDYSLAIDGLLGAREAQQAGNDSAESSNGNARSYSAAMTPDCAG